MCWSLCNLYNESIVLRVVDALKFLGECSTVPDILKFKFGHGPMTDFQCPCIPGHREETIELERGPVSL